ncbi:GyrI-like domain-containing protein [Bradyrhizobium sp. GCM10027634]|uniref:AraC family transcriptional regulator n=1 Tax=unclassified Bradyrhizobium TaxID=2631580 RepID=UPI00188D55E8|nr:MULTISPECIES: AraC family transcriptional regulator [unclassified Bradyrhizobium]MDN5001675.1 AraC family transcriptional regulator [Bradyrhizobium sp. WYCCWR 12677]QOZ45998.1 AraC family transcriptional regulator [Bradyrhizobium sp. CCBAU 53340]
MTAALQNYQARMRRVLDHIDRHLDADLDLDSLSSVAAFSKFHFHRQFTATFGLSVHRYVQLARMKRASYRLAYRDDEPVTEIAMDAGYEAPDAFARAFRQRFGQSPSSFRKSPDWEPWLAAFGPLEDARSKLMQTSLTNDDVTIRNVPTTKVAIMEHRGSPTTLPATIQRFVAWRKAAGLHPSNHPTFTVWRSERRPASPADYSVDLCVGTDQPIAASGEEVKAGEIPGGRCAVLRVTGYTDNLEPAALFLYRDWLPASGEEARDFPIYCQRLSFFPEVPEHETVAELFLPLK